MTVQPKEIQRYQTSDGKVPFDGWFLNLRDTKVQTIINKRLDRVSAGNLGNYRSVGEGVYEFKIDYKVRGKIMTIIFG